MSINVLNQPISVLKLETREVNCLTSLKAETVRDALQLWKERIPLEHCANWGPRSFLKIEKALARLGLTISMKDLANAVPDPDRSCVVTLDLSLGALGLKNATLSRLNKGGYHKVGDVVGIQLNKLGKLDRWNKHCTDDLQRCLHRLNLAA